MLVSCEFKAHQLEGIGQILTFFFFIDEIVYKLIISKTASVRCAQRCLFSLSVNLLKDNS
jgi:hypothetical protein